MSADATIFNYIFFGHFTPLFFPDVDTSSVIILSQPANIAYSFKFLSCVENIFLKYTNSIQ